MYALSKAIAPIFLILALSGCDSHELSGFCDKAFECRSVVDFTGPGECADQVDDDLRHSVEIGDITIEEEAACRAALIELGDTDGCDAHRDFLNQNACPARVVRGLEFHRLF